MKPCFFLKKEFDIVKYTAKAYEEIYVETRCRKPHIIASGEKNAPPLILLHGIWTKRYRKVVL